MKSYDIFSFVNGKMRMEITTKSPEQLLNIFSKRNVIISDIKREDLYKISFSSASENYKAIYKVCEDTKSELNIKSVSKAITIATNLKKYSMFIGGVGISLCIIFILSFFVWKIDIEGDKHISPYEIRQSLKEMGVSRGVLKRNIDIKDIEDKIIYNNRNVLWSKVRIQGSTLKVEVVESLRPPVIEIDNSLGKIVASKDGEIVRVYSESGTSVVKKGDIVKKGDVLIDGYQGKEGSFYETPPIGSVIAKTFMEFEEVVELEGEKSVNTKNSVNEYYLSIFGKKLFLKKYKDEFKDFDKFNSDGKLIKKNIYYEVNKSSYTLDPENVKKSLVEYYTKNIRKNLKDTDIIAGILVDDEIQDNKLKMKISFIIEEDIGVKIPKIENN